MASDVASRRESETNKVVVYGAQKSSLYFTFSFDLSGETPRVQEAFCSVEKTGSDERAYMDVIARLVSRLLRHTSVEEVATLLEGVVTSVRGPVKSPSGVKFCFGYIDLFGKELRARQLELEAQHAQQELSERGIIRTESHQAVAG